MLILSVIEKILKFMKVLAQRNIMIMFLVVMLLKLFALIIDFSKPIVVYRGENAAYEFIKAILKEYKYCKNIMKKHFNKNLIMSEEEEHLFQQSNSCWICKDIINHDDGKVRNHCHITSKRSRTSEL